jgi:hypothetical protein
MKQRELNEHEYTLTKAQKVSHTANGITVFLVYCLESSELEEHREHFPLSVALPPKLPYANF